MVSFSVCSLKTYEALIYKSSLFLVQFHKKSIPQERRMLAISLFYCLVTLYNGSPLAILTVLFITGAISVAKSSAIRTRQFPLLSSQNRALCSHIRVYHIKRIRQNPKPSEPKYFFQLYFFITIIMRETNAILRKTILRFILLYVNLILKVVIIGNIAIRIVAM